MTLSGEEYLHRFPILNPQNAPTNDFALVLVSAKKLDFPLNILATDGEAPFETKLTRRDASALRLGGQHQATESEWESQLLSVLLQRQTSKPGPHHLGESVEVLASLNVNVLSLVFRKRVADVTQRLGEVPLNRNDDLEIDTVAWTHTAVQRGDSLQSNLESLQATLSQHTTEISSLNKQLEDLVAAKKEHESVLTTRFCELINEKKLKIRDQQRLLASAKVDPQRESGVKASRASGDGKPSASRKWKRKVPMEESTNGSDGEDENDDRVKREDSEDVAEKQTPTMSPTQSDTTDDEDDENQRSTTMGATSQAMHSEPTEGHDQDVMMEGDKAPPTRELPFGKPSGSSATASKGPDSSAIRQDDRNDHDDDETTDDDEL